MLTPKEFISKLDLSKLDDITAQEIRSFISSEEYKYIDLSENLDEYKRVVEFVETNFPEAIGLQSNEDKVAEEKKADEERVAKEDAVKKLAIEAKEEEQAAKDADELHKSLLSLKKLENKIEQDIARVESDSSILDAIRAKTEKLSDRLELVKEMASDAPKNQSLKDRIELISEMLDEAKTELKEVEEKSKLILEEQFKDGGDLGKSIIGWRTDKEPSGEKYYYAFVEGEFISTPADNIKPKGSYYTCINNYSTHKMDRDFLSTKERQQIFEKQMAGLFPELPISVIKNVTLYYEEGGSLGDEQKYVAVHESEDGYWTIASKPTSKENAQEMLGGTPKNEIGKVVTLEEAISHKKVLGREYLKVYAHGGSIDDWEVNPNAIPDEAYFALNDMDRRFVDTQIKVEKQKDGSFKITNNEGHSMIIEKHDEGTNELIVWKWLNQTTKEKIGVYASGGFVNNYKGKSAEEIWNEYTIQQKAHFLRDHNLSDYIGAHLAKYKFLADAIKQKFTEHISEVQYANGGDIEGFQVGQSVITNDNGNDYTNGRYKGRELVIQHKDKGRYSFTVRDTGRDVPFSLDASQIEQYATGGSMATGGKVENKTWIVNIGMHSEKNGNTALRKEEIVLGRMSDEFDVKQAIKRKGEDWLRNGKVLSIVEKHSSGGSVETGGGVDDEIIAGKKFYDTRYDKSGQIISVDGGMVKWKYLNKVGTEFENESIHSLVKNQFEYLVGKGAYQMRKGTEFSSGGEVGNFKYKKGDIVYVFQYHSKPSATSAHMTKEELTEYNNIAPKYIVEKGKGTRQKWSKVEILEQWADEKGWESYKVKQLDGYRKEKEFVAGQSQMSKYNSEPIAIGYMKEGGGVWTKDQEEKVSKLDFEFEEAVKQKGIERNSKQAADFWRSGGFQKRMGEIFGKEYAEGGEISTLTQEELSKFETILNKYVEKDYFGTSELVESKEAYRKQMAAKGDELAIKTTKKEIAEEFYAKDYINNLNAFRQLKTWIETGEKDKVKSRLRANQKLTIEYFEALTGKSLKGATNQKSLDAIVDSLSSK